MSTALRRCVVVGGAGAVGGMFAAALAGSGAEVCVVDLVPPSRPIQFECGDITVPTPGIRTVVGAADLVLLAVPERVALAAAAWVTAEMRQGALLAHTLSVQSRFAAALRAAASRVEVVGLNPMYSPTLGMAGRPVVAVVLNDGPRVARLLELISDQGGRVVRLGAEEHDRLAAATQALTHAAVLAFGLALAHLEADITLLRAIAPPPHATMLALLARIASGTPQVYWDVQHANPYGTEARAALAHGLDRLRSAIPDEVAFTAVLQECRAVLGDELERYRAACARIFDGPLLDHPMPPDHTVPPDDTVREDV